MKQIISFQCRLECQCVDIRFAENDSRSSLKYFQSRIPARIVIKNQMFRAQIPYTTENTLLGECFPLFAENIIIAY